MNSVFALKVLLLWWLAVQHTFVVAQDGKAVSVNQVATDFTKLLQRPKVAPQPYFQQVANDSVKIEKGFFYAEINEQVPVLIYKPASGKAKTFPVVICLHGTGGSKDAKEITTMLYRLSALGIMGVAIDARFHGARINGGADGSTQYVQAITRAWGSSDTVNSGHPFLFDTVYDLWRLIDYLQSRSDVQSDRIGMTGISMGGIETWLAASTDKRIKVAVPIIAVQSFKWSLDNGQWQGRASTIKAVHEQAAKDMGDSVVSERSVVSVWNKLLPGITGEFDCPSMIRLIAPRPLLILNNENDGNCPLGGARVAFEAAEKAYLSHHAADRLKIIVTPNQPHRLLNEHVDMMLEWFKKWL